MMTKANLLAFLVAGALSVGLFAPTTAMAKPGKAKGKGQLKEKTHTPPPFAPAHGYKHTHEDGSELTYDSTCGAYTVTEKPGVYFQNGVYLSLSNGVWKVTANLAEEWRSPKDGEVPEKLKTIVKPKVVKPIGKIKK